jgi:RNA polymerase sigma factor (sigma-70 family)
MAGSALPAGYLEPPDGYRGVVFATTRTLLARATSSPRSAFGEIYVRAAPQIEVWAAVHVAPSLRGWLTIDDFVQEVWARAYASFASYDAASGRFRSWLIGICYNVLREQLRTVRLRRHADLEVAGVADRADPATSVLLRVDRSERSRELFAVIAELEPVDRRLLAWRGVESLPFAVIGARLSLSTVAAESRWRRLVERIRHVLPQLIDE